MRHIPSVLIFSANFSLRLFLDCSYFSSIFQPSCSYKVCSYKKKRVYWQWRTHLFAEEMNKKHKNILFGYFKF